MGFGCSGYWIFGCVEHEEVKKRLCVDCVPIERFGLVLDLILLKMKRQLEKSKSCGTSSTSAPKHKSSSSSQVVSYK
ncbi:hypothetical protein RchiOBHm_Chr6g0272231 [Rosa chinensis]|uniref:Uncharacterized protein n=1 Tax=Rosa chinensis TaxID=74649 RepID=A0A2P6PR74_ROSCH|nr:hypothetical protein RchiOBHm_Chr6g0272231 [Rosa chinensis]